MENGTFNKIIKIGNIVIKISKNDKLSNQIINEMGSNDVRKYTKDINNVGINVPKLFADFSINGTNIMIQEFIEGITVQELLLSDLDTNTKLSVLEEFLIAYQRSKKNKNLCLDWNLKNFIVNSNIYYIDFVPCLYKDKIETVTSPNLIEYKQTYLDEQIQTSGIMSYALLAIFKTLTKEESKKVFYKVKQLFEAYANIVNYDFEKEHVYMYKMKEIIEYINTDMEYSELAQKVKMYSMRRKEL